MCDYFLPATFQTLEKMLEVEGLDWAFLVKFICAPSQIIPRGTCSNEGSIVIIGLVFRGGLGFKQIISLKIIINVAQAEEKLW